MRNNSKSKWSQIVFSAIRGIKNIWLYFVAWSCKIEAKTPIWERRQFNVIS
jgi:hypothetical protein